MIILTVGGGAAIACGKPDGAQAVSAGIDAANGRGYQDRTDIVHDATTVAPTPIP